MDGNPASSSVEALVPEDNYQAPQPNNAPAQTENQAQVPNTEISALAQYRERKAAQASSVLPQNTEVGVQPQTNVGQEAPQEPAREQYIPRDRFDEVIQQRNQLQQQIQNFQMQQSQQQVVGPTGMVQSQQAPVPQAQQAAVQSWLETVTKDPTSRQQWQKRISNEGVTALADFVRQAVESVGRPMLEEYSKNVRAQITPIQQQYVNQHVSAYAQQRQSDPEFAAAKPAFDNLVNTAVQRGYDVMNPQVLGTLEFMAKQQARQYAPPAQFQQPPQPTPFSERPGNGGQNFGKPQTPNLTPQQIRMAERFGMTPQQYADGLRSMENQ